MDIRIKIMKHNIIKAATKAGEGHIASAFSILDILWIIYDRILDLEGIRLRSKQRDVFILSKGHASLGLYAILTEKGFISEMEFNTFCQYQSILGGHPDCNKVPGVEASTGSLGHGFPMAVGVAMGYKIQGIKSKVFTIVGDGECNEGTIWESALLAAHHKLNNLYCIVDYNHSTDRALGMGNFQAKFSAFGWESIVINGHDHNEIYKALKRESQDKPMAIIAETIKGKGCARMENNPEWHHKAPRHEELEDILKEMA
jgi:transketolase